MSFPQVHRFAAALSLVAALGAAHAKPIGICSSDGPGGANQISTTAGGNGLYFTDLKRTVDNTGTGKTQVYVWFSADVGVPLDAEVRLLFSVDGADPQYYGPQNLANNTQFYQSRSTLARIAVGPGKHTIVPFVYVSAAGGQTAVFDDRCMFVEI